MKILLIIFIVSVLSVAFVGKSISFAPRNVISAKQKIIDQKLQSGRGCSPDFSSINFNDSANSIPLLDGWGKYRMPVTVKNDSANIYFQQGINMYYSFHIIEALASFEKSVSFDDNFAMGHWGKALAYGPNINDIVYTTLPDALSSVAKAKSLSSQLTPVEKALIGAMGLRYSADSTQKREHLDQLYADAMKKVHASFPDHADAAALYADALMVQHPWDLYDRLYNPKGWTPEIVRVLEKLIIQFPENPGANHYYIHAIEGSKTPEKGLEVANRLGGLMPKVSHLVHMPSHIYIRSGQYEKGAQVNTLAVEGYREYKSRFPMVANNNFLYQVHNHHMQAACAAMDAQYEKSLKFSFDTQQTVDSSWLDAGGYFGVYSQNMYVITFFTWLRFGKWDEILKASSIPESRVYANSMSHFARGIALARKHEFSQATKELEQMIANKSNPQLKESPSTFNPGHTAIEVGEKILRGVLAEEQNKLPNAIILLKEAVDIEGGMFYNEPRDWILPARHYLGQALLKANKLSEAEKVYKEDLLVNPNNGWALTGLKVVLTKQKRNKEASQVDQQAKKALARTDVEITGSVF